MGFLDKLRDRLNYQDAPLARINYGEGREFGDNYLRAALAPHIGPEPGSRFGGPGGSDLSGLGASRGLIDRVGQSRSMQGGGGNIDGSPNVVYDPSLEQFEANRKLKSRELDIENLKAQGILENNRILNESRMMTAQAATERAAIARMRAENPNLVFRAMPGGNLMALDPASGEVTDTGISSGTMTQEGAIGLRTQGQKDIAQLRNEGALDVQALRNSGALESLGIRNEAQLERLMRALEANKANTIFKEGQNTWRTKLREGVIDPNDPVEGRVPTFPMGDINLPSGTTTTSPIQGPPEPNRPAINLLGGTSSSMQSPINSLQLSPQQYSSFSAKPGQYTAAPGQFTAGTPAAEIAAKGGNPQELRTQAETYLKSKGLPVDEANLAYIMNQLQQKQQQSQTSGTTPTGTPQTRSGGSRYGTVTPLGTPLRH